MRRQKVCVLGAGIVGVTTAWALSHKGCEVTVLEQEEGVARGTSFANGAQISVSNAMPWSNPSAPSRVFAGLMGRNRGVFIKPRLSWEQWRWGASFLYNCRLGLTRRNLEKMVAICARSRQLYRQLIEEEKIDFDCLDNGILHFYSDQREYDLSRKNQSRWAHCLSAYRCEVSPEEMLVIEPALRQVKDVLVGGFYAREDMTGDAHRFSVALAERCATRGVVFQYRSKVLRIQLDTQGVIITTDSGELRSDCVVCCLGTQSDGMLAPLGIKSDIYPVKGYSITIELRDEESKRAAPNTSLLDDRHKIVASRLGNRLRVAGIAEIGDDSADAHPQHIELLTDWTQTFFPAVSLDEFSSWAGLRPLTPSGIPCVGRSQHPQVWLNCGHGALGWTTAMATAEEVACGIMESRY